MLCLLINTFFEDAVPNLVSEIKKKSKNDGFPKGLLVDQNACSWCYKELRLNCVEESVPTAKQEKLHNKC